MLYQRRKHTFAVAFILAAFAASAGAQVIGKTMTVATMPACNSPKNFGLVTDATNATTLGAGGGSAAVWVTCASGSWAIDEVAAVADLSAYLPVNGEVAADVAVTVSGAGNDVELIAADDVILTPTDAITAVAGGAVTLTATSGTMALASSAGAITVTAVGATNDVTLTAADDVILAATDDTTVAGDQFAVNTTTAVVDAGGGADEITVAAASTTFVGLVRITQAAAPPVACGAGVEGGLYFDSDTHLLCGCNGSAWVQIADGSTGCS